VAYYTRSETNEQSIGAEELRAYLMAKLPEYMVPAAYVRLESLPLTPNGKLDRKALPRGGRCVCSAGVRGAAWGEGGSAGCHLGGGAEVERVGRQDNFFELGGHSLLAVRVISRCVKHWA